MEDLHRFQRLRALGHELAIGLPDSSSVTNAFRHVESIYPSWLFNHVLRSWLFSLLMAKNRGAKPDPEVLAISALFHDYGLATPIDPSTRFEVAGANAARAFSIREGFGLWAQTVIWDSIALHTTPSIARHKGEEVALCQVGIGVDFTGFNIKNLRRSDIDHVVEHLPRLGMKAEMRSCLCRVAAEAPVTTYDNAVANFGERYVEDYKPFSIADALAGAPFHE